MRFLPPVVRKPRVELRETGFVPEKVGAAEVCLWKGDAIGAATFTVDDNSGTDVPWWIETAAKYHARITWFVIPNIVDDRNPLHGTWAGYQSALDAGHDIQSHSFTHLADESLTIDEEYGRAVESIERHLPGHRVVAVGFPGARSSRKNTWAASGRHHIGGRGTTGVPNDPVRINYQCSNSFHGDFTLDAQSFVGLSNLVVRNTRFPLSYRAWNCHHLHGVPQEERRAQIERAMAFYAEHGVWMPGFVDVLKYGQERDSAAVETVECRADRIVLRLTDHMDDSLFDAPLTLRLRVPDGWTAAAVRQGERKETVAVDKRDGKASVLFDAVPDRGDIVVADCTTMDKNE